MRRAIERNTARYYNRKRQYPEVRRSYQRRCTLNQHLIFENTGDFVKWMKPNDFRNSIMPQGENYHAYDLQLRKECLMQRSGSSLDNWFNVWAKHHVQDLSFEEVKELERFLDQCPNIPIDAYLERGNSKSETGVVERFQAWLILALYSRSFQKKI
jgi:hypothetical protein